jgi:hypothetical protein
MVPMKNSTIFKSRWMALLWAAGIIWFAYDFAGSQPNDQNASANAEQSTDDTNNPTNTDDEKKLADALKSF